MLSTINISFIIYPASKFLQDSMCLMYLILGHIEVDIPALSQFWIRVALSQTIPLQQDRPHIILAHLVLNSQKDFGNML